ncbi:MAG: hypothetical protein CVU71_01780 [Deltaproteobacteria bacterium HGW-Deltaproteobacteria-6]|jgi:alpha 1,2-mannosyltransferase|nr:MAG: hypothetical protein CVU71_01780 [Deltaproteobacteria bacterium HGW-Deltaproteobacteria-6]
MNEKSFYRELLETAYACFPDYPEGRFRGRGIVLCAGGFGHLSNAYVCLKFLRTYTDLPVELFYAGPEEMPEGVRDLLQKDFAPIALTDITQCRFPEDQLSFSIRDFKGFQIKPYALLYSSFEEIFYMDADNIPLRSPVPLFAMEEYEQTGALFWPDLPGMKQTTDDLFAVFGIASRFIRQGSEFESGQIVLDKRRCWKALLTVCLANSDTEGFRNFCYRNTLGDKDTFRLSFQFAGKSYHLEQHPPLQIGNMYFIIPIPLTDFTIKIQHDRGAFYATGILQHDPEGQPLFAHKTVCEWDLYQPFQNLLYLESGKGDVQHMSWLAQRENEGYEFLEEFHSRCKRFFGWQYLRRFRGLLAVVIIAFLNTVKFRRNGRASILSQKQPAEKESGKH